MSSRGRSAANRESRQSALASFTAYKQSLLVVIIATGM